MEALRDCNGCHACCTRAGSPPFGDVEIVKQLPEILRDELLDYYASVRGRMSREAMNLPCLWLVNGRCKYYEHRPAVCRGFVVGGIECQEFVALGVGVR